MKRFSFCIYLSSLHVFNPENHKINLIWCKTFWWNLLQNLLRSSFEGAKQKSHTSEILPFSFCLNLYRRTILHLIKTFCNKTFKKSIRIATKACNHERIISSDLKPEVDTSLNITCRKVMITYCITNHTNLFFWLGSSIAIRHWNRHPKNSLYSFYIKCSVHVRSFD